MPLPVDTPARTAEYRRPSVTSCISSASLTIPCDKSADSRLSVGTTADHGSSPCSPDDSPPTRRRPLLKRTRPDEREPAHKRCRTGSPPALSLPDLVRQSQRFSTPVSVSSQSRYLDMSLAEPEPVLVERLQRSQPRVPPLKLEKVPDSSAPLAAGFHFDYDGIKHEEQLPVAVVDARASRRRGPCTPTTVNTRTRAGIFSHDMICSLVECTPKASKFIGGLLERLVIDMAFTQMEFTGRSSIDETSIVFARQVHQHLR